jgi:hypothetical protein
MIDFEALASERAKALSQPPDEWVATTRQPFFEAACGALSDGEIMQLFSIAEEPPVLAALAEALADAVQSGETMAFDKWKNAFTANKLGLDQAARLWAQTWPKHKNFAKCLALIAVPSELSRRKQG